MHVNITPKNLTATLSCSNKTYDGNATASCTGTVTPVSGDTVTVTPSSCTFNNKNVGTGKAISCSTMTLGGADAGNYTVTTPGSDIIM